MKSSLALVLFLALPVLAEPPLKERLQDQNADGHDHWIYNDLAAGFEEAKRTNRPLFVTFRCVPCKACMQFDALVAGDHPELETLAKKFVPVRQVEMKGVDLSQFQFDCDLNWAAMFLNADGTVYARYGTQSEEGPDAYNSPESLVKTMQRVLKLHDDYPANQELFSGKKGTKKPYKTALEMPGLPNKDKFRQQTQTNNCIHCHNIHDAEVFAAYDAGTFSNEMLWRFPLPQNIGLEINRSDGRHIEKVRPSSPAAKAGMQAGETVTRVDGQAILSIADVQWALHNLGRETNQVTIEVEKSDDVSKSYHVSLPKGWRETDISWRGSIWSVPPRLRIWLPEPDEKEAKRHQLPEGTPAVVARWINTGEEAGRLAQKAGLQTGDLIVEVDGKPVPSGGGAAFSTFVKLHYKPGEKLPLTVLRDGKRIEVDLPLVR